MTAPVAVAPAAVNATANVTLLVRAGVGASAVTAPPACALLDDAGASSAGSGANGTLVYSCAFAVAAAPLNATFSVTNGGERQRPVWVAMVGQSDRGRHNNRLVLCIPHTQTR